MTLDPARPGQVLPHGRTVPIPAEELARRSKIVREALQAEAHAKNDVERAYYIRVRRRELAAVDSAAFCEFVLRTEKGNKPIVNAPVHIEWHQILAWHRWVAFWAAIEMGKTQQLSIGYPLWRLGRSGGEDRIILVSDPREKAMKLGRVMQHHIERNDALHEVFPLLRRSRRHEDQWGAHAFTVQRKTFSAKDPSVQVTGVKGSVSGSRADYVVFDDAVTRRNSRTEEQRKELSEWATNECYGRLSDEGQTLNANTAMHPDDLTNERANIPGTFAKRYAVRDERGLPRTPNWSVDRLEQMALSLGTWEGVEARRQLLVEDVGDEESRFKDEWIRKCLRDDLQLVYRLTKDERDQLVAQGAVLVCGNDFAALKRRPGSRTAFFVAAVFANGDHQLLWIEAGRWTSPEIRNRMISIFERFGAVNIVEDNGVQSWVMENVSEISDTPMVPHTTGSNKHDPTHGVESLGIQMSLGKWYVPTHPAEGQVIIPGDPRQIVQAHPDFGVLPFEVCEWIKELKRYAPNTHPGDSLMASWKAKEGARMLRAVRGGSVDVLGGDAPPPKPKRTAIEVELRGGLG